MCSHDDLTVMLCVSQVPGIVICDTYGNSHELDENGSHHTESSSPFVIPDSVSQSIVRDIPRGYHGCPDALLRCLPAQDELAVLPYVALEAPLKVKRRPRSEDFALKPTLPDVSRGGHATINVVSEEKASAVVPKRHSLGEVNTSNVDGGPNKHMSSSDDISCWETLNAINACASSCSVEYDCRSGDIERDTGYSLTLSRYHFQGRTCEQCDEPTLPIAYFLQQKGRNSGIQRTERFVDDCGKDTFVATNLCTMHNNSCFVRDEYADAVTSECVERNNNDTWNMTSLANADPGSVNTHLALHAMTSSALDSPPFNEPSTCTCNYSSLFTSTPDLRAFNGQQGKCNNSDDVRNSHAPRELIAEATANKTVAVKDNKTGRRPRDISHKETVFRGKNGIRASQLVNTGTDLFDKKLTIYLRGRPRSCSPRHRKQRERNVDTKSQPVASV